jgi:hypothetical protein
MQIKGSKYTIFSTHHMPNAGLRFPIPPLVEELLVEMTLSLGQIKPNGWRFITSCCTLWYMVVGGAIIAQEFFICILG